MSGSYALFSCYNAPAISLKQAKPDGSYSKPLNAIAGLNLLIIDDWGLEPLNAATRNDLMEPG